MSLSIHTASNYTLYGFIAHYSSGLSFTKKLSRAQLGTQNILTFTEALVKPGPLDLDGPGS